ncbi:hypothetical protein NX059_000909 [Plenodomus lindquistii]|nr:hypothetical protein NX059_000909 [Plenodomus lindquistii]
MALQIGALEGKSILAFPIRHGPSGYQITYGLRLKDGSHVVRSDCTKQVKIAMSASLGAPFKYVIGKPAVTALRDVRLITLISWFFLRIGYMDTVGIGHKTFCINLDSALQGIASGEEATAATTEGQQGQRLETSATMSRQNASFKPHPVTHELPLKSNPTVRLQVGNSEVFKMEEYLIRHSAVSLLDGIPALRKMNFSDQTRFARALPKKLVIGYTNAENEVSAYMYKVRSSAETGQYVQAIHCYEEIGMVALKVEVKNLVAGTHLLCAPFDIILKSVDTNQNECQTEYLDTILRWYFIASGIAHMPRGVAGDNDEYMKQFHCVLKYIASLAPPAPRLETRALESTPSGGPATPKIKGGDKTRHATEVVATSAKPSPSIDHMGLVPKSHSTAMPSPSIFSTAESSTGNLQSTASASRIETPMSQRGTKRSARVAALDAIIENVSQYKAYTEELEDTDDRLQDLDNQQRKFEQDLSNEDHELKEKLTKADKRFKQEQELAQQRFLQSQVEEMRKHSEEQSARKQEYSSRRIARRRSHDLAYKKQKSDTLARKGSVFQKRAELTRLYPEVLGRIEDSSAQL